MSAAAEFRAAIAASLGHAPDDIVAGRMLRFATSGKSRDTAGWAKLFDDQEAGVYGCHRQGISGVWVARELGTLSATQRAERAEAIELAKREREAALVEQRTVNAARVAKTWAACLPVRTDDAVFRYLSTRKVLVDPLPHCIRLHPSLTYWHEGSPLGEWPAMVAPLVSPRGEIAALHRTYLSEDGQKAPVPSAKKLTGAAGSLTGAAIPLFQPSAGVLGVAEGIETALAAYLGSGVPTVAAYSAGALAAFQWRQGLSRLVVFGDNDRAGRDAAEALRRRAVAASLQCSVLVPSSEGLDWADVRAETA